MYRKKKNNMKNKNIKFLHISTNKNGGVGTVVKSLCNYFKDSLSVILYKESMKKLSIYKQYKQLKNEIKILLNNVDLLHFHGSWAPHIFILRKKQPKPTLVSPHGALHKISLKKSQFKKFIAKQLYVKKTYLNANCIHALTMQEVNDIYNFGIKNIPIAVIPNGIDFDEKLEIDEKTKNELLEISKDRKVILSLSRLDPLKGIDLLIDSFNIVIKKNKDLVLFIVGDGNENYKTNLLNKIYSLGLKESVYLLGEMNGIYKNTVYDIADVFVLPSYNEGFGLTVIEAYRQNIPVITTTATPFEEIANNGIGWYIEPNCSEVTKALASATKLDKSELSSMGKKGYNLMKKKYSLDIVNHKMELLYSWLLNGGIMPDFIIKNYKESKLI